MTQTPQISPLGPAARPGSDLGRPPDFLIIGAMKSGTTTLYRDLETQPGVFFPWNKEPEHLARDTVLTPAGRAEYHALFAKALAEQKRGEASTAYTKRPAIDGVAGRALEICGPDLKLIYLVRNPLERAISHHYHRMRIGRSRDPIDPAMRELPEYADWGRYAYQLEPWLEAFGREAVQIVVFEEFIADRLPAAERACRHIGAEFDAALIDSSSAHNVGAQMKDPRHGVVGAVRSSWAYRRLIKPALPVGARTKIREALGRRPVPPPPPPQRSTLEALAERVADDAEALGRLLGRGGSPWDLAATIEQIAPDRPADGPPRSAGGSPARSLATAEHA